MRKVFRKTLAFLLAIAMVSATLLQAAPVQAAPITKTMAHLVASDANGNGHFGGSTPEAFVLSSKADITDEDFSFTMKMGTESQMRFRFVNKYVDDTHWSYIAYDGMNDPGAKWFAEYKNGSTNDWPGISGLPDAATGDVVTVSGSYTASGLTLTVENVTQKTSGTATVTDSNVLGLKDQEGKIGFGAGYRNNTELQQTEVYFVDVKSGETELGFSDFAAYSGSAAFTYELAEAVIGDDGNDGDDGEEEDADARKWFVLTPGAATGGHNYGQASGPLFYYDTDKQMTYGSALTMAIKPNTNFGVFYGYIDDSNWLYVGYDNSSKWYYEYKLNGSGAYASISGLPEAVAGEELSFGVSLSQETLTVSVNGTAVSTPVQAFLNWATKVTEANGNLGKFGIMSKGSTSPISIADVEYNNGDCMKDDWAFLVERSGQTVSVETTAMEPVSGTVTNAEGAAVAGATVRIGVKSATTAADGTYRIKNVQVGNYAFSVSKPGYQAYSDSITVTQGVENVKDAVLQRKPDLDLDNYDSISSNEMTVYVGENFPLVARYVMNDAEGAFFRGNETNLNTVVINGVTIEPEVTVVETKDSYKVYRLAVEDTANSIDFVMDVKISVEKYNLTWEVTALTKADGCAKIASINIPTLNLLSVDASEEDAVFAGAQLSTTTTDKKDTYITWDKGFVPSNKEGYTYAFLTNGKLSAGLHSNSEIKGDSRVVRVNGADSMSLTSAEWYYEAGDTILRNDVNNSYALDYTYPVSELPIAKVAIANGDLNGDNEVDWNDGAIAFRDVMHYAYGTEAVKDLVNYRIVMNFESAAPNPFLQTADNVKKVYLATDGLPQALLLKGYGNEGHDSANSEYADIAEREGGVEDFQKLIEIAHQYNTEVGIHVNAQEIYPEARSFNETMISTTPGNLNGNGWGWLDQSVVINKYWDLSSNARLKRFVQLYDRINETNFLSLDWDKKEYVKDSQGKFLDNNGNEVSREKVMELITADNENRPDNMDFIYLDVWYQDSWETRRIAEEINSLGWRFSTEFSYEGEYDSTWQHWSTDTTYGGAGAKGFNSDIIRFLKNDLRDSQVLNWPAFGGTADNPLLGGFRLYGFEGWVGQQNFNEYIHGTFTENVPTKFLQHYQVIDWENYPAGQSPVGNTEKQITLKNGNDVVVVTRNEEQRSDIEIERTITLNGKVVLNTDADEHTYLLPWTDNQNGEAKLYHWNLDGGTTTWELQDDWANLENVVVYELSDQGRINETEVEVVDGTVTLEAKASVAYVVVKGAEAKAKELVAYFGEGENVVDPGFNGYVDGEKLAAPWTGDIASDGVQVVRTNLGDQKLEMTNEVEDVAVTIELTDLAAGEDYVAEVYVENLSEGIATLEVNTGSEVKSSYTAASIVTNTVSCDSEHGTKMQRMLVPFVADGTTAELTLAKTAGEGAVYWDDIRIVEQKLDNYKEDGSFEQDFESVVQGLYPFVLKYNAGGDSRTHLSQLNAPYTQAGWNGKSVDDVLGGEWSLKHHTNITGVVYQTIPQNFRFEAGKVYNVEFDYQTISRGYQMIVGDGATFTAPTTYLATTNGTTHASMQVVGSGSGQTWIGLYMNGSLCYDDTAIGNVDFILDNLVITEDKDAIAVTIDKTEMYLGEAATIFGAGLDQVTWTTSKEGVVEVDKDNNKINTIGTGTVTVTATYGEGETETFEITVSDTTVETIDRSEFSGITAAANTEQLTGEPAPSGPAAAIVDGRSDTFWHSNYNSPAFNVNENNPAIITIDLGETMEIGGFRFQQRNQANRVITQYGYQIKDAAGNVLVSERGISVPTQLQSGLAWVTEALTENKEAKVIVFYVEGAIEGGFGCLAEFEPIRVKTVATDATLEDAEVEVGQKVTLEVTPVGGTMLKGLVWTSSNEKVATVNANGVVTGVKAGTATITVSNSLGELDTCTVTVSGEVEEPDTEHTDDSYVCQYFADVAHGAWYEEAVQYVFKEEIMTGIGGTDTFEPETDVIRAVVIETLYKLEGRPSVARYGAPTLDDFNEEDWWSDALTWAFANGIATGNTYTNTFDGMKVVTREEVATFLYRYAQYKDNTAAVAGDVDTILGDTEVSDWAEEAFAWVVENGIITGIETETGAELAPAEGAVRAQLATIMMRFNNLK